MEFYSIESHPLRVYLRGDMASLSKLVASLRNRFYQESEYSKDTDIDNIIFVDENDFYYFPIGLMTIIENELYSLGIPVKNSVKLPEPSHDTVLISNDFLEGIELRGYQAEAIRVALRHKNGLLKLATGAGKTEIMIGICKYLFENKLGNILICVPTSNLLHQTYERMVKRGIPEHHISKYGDGNKIDTTCRIAVATIQTVHRRLNDSGFKEWYTDIRGLLLDEGHHGSCNTWSTVIDTLSAEYNIAVSAEPFYGDQDHVIRDLILRGLVGPIIYNIDISYLIARGYLSKPYYISLDSSYQGNILSLINWQSVNKTGIINNKLRNELITDTVNILIEKGKNPLILISQIKHGVLLAESISKLGRRVALMTGGSSVTIYDGGMELDSYIDKDGDIKKDFQDGKVDALIGTSIMDEGVDMPSIASVVLAGGGKSGSKLLQRIGRGLRPKSGDNTTIIVDFQDKFNVVTKKHSKTRKEVVDRMHIAVYYIRDMNSFSNLVTHLIVNRP